MATSANAKKGLVPQKINLTLPKVKVSSQKSNKNINTVYKESKGGPYYIPGVAGNYRVCIPRFN